MSTILLDCDGVLSDFIGGLLPIIKQVTGRDVTREMIDRWDWATALGMTGVDASAVKHSISKSLGWCEALDVLPGAVDGVRALRKNHDVYIVTSP